MQESAELSMQRFTFGKHRGKTYDEVRCSDKSYCTWALRQENPSGGLYEFVQYLNCIPETATHKRKESNEQPTFTAKRQRTSNAVHDVTTIEGEDAKRLRWHLTRGGLFKKRSGGKLVSKRPLSPDEEAYIERLRALTKSRGGVLDDEVKPTPKAFWPLGVTAGPFKCGPNALPHNRGRWFFKRGDGDILWANGAEPFSDSQQALFRDTYESDVELEYGARGYRVGQHSAFDFLFGGGFR